MAVEHWLPLALTEGIGPILPARLIAGAHAGSTPPDLMRDPADLIPGSRFHLLRQAGHLPPVDAPADWAAAVTQFLRDIGHI